MVKKSVVVLLVLACMVLPGIAPALAAGGQQGQTWLAGSAAYPVTPLQENLDSGVYLGGYGIGPFRGTAEGVRDDVWARALALSSGGESVVLVVLDLPCIGCYDVENIRKRVAEGAGIPWNNVLVSVTHTHAGPDLLGLFGGVPEEYREYLRDQAVTAGLEAFQGMQQAVLTSAMIDCEGTINNRRDAPHLDTMMTVLRAASTEDETIATLVIFGVHTTFLGSSNLLVSADLAGPLVAALEEELGGTAMFAAGIEGDQSPSKRGMSMDEYGQELAGYALEALDAGATEVLPGSLELRQRRFKLSVRNAVFFLGALLGLMTEYKFCFSFCHGFYVTAEVNHLILGDSFALATVPGEILARLGLEVKEMMSGFQHTALIGLTSGDLGYFVHEEDWKDGIPFLTKGYEESASVGKHAGPALRDRLRVLIEGN